MLNKQEKELYKKYNGLLAGVDEAGRGPWAGPVVAACVILPEKFKLPGLNDSKQVTETQREELYEKIIQIAQVGCAFSHSDLIDQIGIKRANFEAMKEAITQLDPKPLYLIVDGNDNFPFNIDARFEIKGDSKFACVAAASIVAKVQRDRWMKKIAQKYPEYEFDLHKGYGTERHSSLVKTHGPCAIHRHSYKPIIEILNQQLNLF